jgi:hypothetical protein
VFEWCTTQLRRAGQVSLLLPLLVDVSYPAAGCGADGEHQGEKEHPDDKNDRSDDAHDEAGQRLATAPSCPPEASISFMLLRPITSAIGAMIWQTANPRMPRTRAVVA